MFDFFGLKNKHGGTLNYVPQFVDLNDLVNVFSSLKSNEYNYNDFHPFVISESIAEVYNPIDVISDRVSSVDYFLNDKKGDRVDMDSLPPNLKRLLLNPNFSQTINSLVYQIQFSNLSTGGSYIYPVFATKTKNYNTLSNVYVIQPNNIYPCFKKNITDPFFIKSVNDIVDYWNVSHVVSKKIKSEDIFMHVDNRFDFEKLKLVSPLDPAAQNINNLFVAYQARYNVYSKNGTAGIIAKKTASDGDGLQSYTDGSTRQNIIDEFQKRDGIVGDKNFIAISSIPLEFIKTLGSIQDLQPFDECERDALAILGVYGVSPFLTSQAKNTTFTNQRDAEIALWQNVIMPYSLEMCNVLNKAFYLGDDFSFGCDFSGIQILQKDRGSEIESDLKELDLYSKLKELGIDNKEILNKWKN